MAFSLAAALPKPKYTGEDEEIPAHAQQKGPRIISADKIDQTQIVLKRTGPPPYGSRAGWRPRSQEDFGNGGAFPEIPIAQYPLNMGKKGAPKSNALAIQVDAAGKVKYDAIARQGHSATRTIHTSFKDLIPLRAQANAGEISLERPSAEQVVETTERTRKALEALTNGAVAAQRPKNVNTGPRKEATFVRYTPANQMGDYSKKPERIMKIIERQQDPMEPAKFKHKKIPRGPPSPPPPVMHSPPRKLTAADQEAWRIPPVVSNWKNSKGFTVPLDKRLAADGRTLKDTGINDGFAKLSEAMNVAARKAREDIELRRVMDQKLAEQAKDREEQRLRELAAKAREEAMAAAGPSKRERSISRSPSRSRSRMRSYSRSGTESSPDRSRSSGRYDSRSRSRSRSGPRSDSSLRSLRHRRSYSQSVSQSRSPPYSRSRSGSVESDDERAIRQRERFRREKRKEHEQELRKTRMGTERRAQFMLREQNRDISEKVALGLAKPTASKEGMYDSRLFNQGGGFAAGFNEDNPYDKELFQAQNALASIYRPRGDGGVINEDEGDWEMERIGKNRRFGEVLGKGKFKGSAEQGEREGPVQFEKEEGDFDVDGFLEGKNVSSDGSGKRKEKETGKRGWGLTAVDRREVKRARRGSNDE